MLVISQSCQSIWMEFGILWRLVGIMNVILNLSRPFNNQGNYFVTENFNIGLYLDIQRPISFKLGTMIEITKLYILISV